MRNCLSMQNKIPIQKNQSVSRHIKKKLFTKMAEISDMDWAQHIMMDYAQNLRKDPVKSQNDIGMSFLKQVKMTENTNF